MKNNQGMGGGGGGLLEGEGLIEDFRCIYLSIFFIVVFY